MLKDITLGQFFPGDTPIHKLDPRTKLLCVILYIVALFNAKGPLTYGIMIAVLAVCILVSRVEWRALTRGLKPVYFIVAFTAIMNMFFTSGTPVADVWLLRHITWEGIISAVQMVLRIVMLIMGTFLMTYTTSPIALTDGLEHLLSPLKKLRFPVHELAMMMSIALRFIPTLIGAAVHQRVPPRRRAGHRHGVTLLPWRRGAHGSARPALPPGGLALSGGLRAPDGGHHRPEKIRILTKKEAARCVTSP